MTPATAPNLASWRRCSAPVGSTWSIVSLPDYELFAKIVAAGSSLVARVEDNTAFTVAEERPLDAAAKKAG